MSWPTRFAELAGDTRAPGLLFGFAAHAPQTIRDGIARMEPVWRMVKGD